MFSDLREKSNRWLRESIKAHKKVIFDCYQYRYFAFDGEDFARCREQLSDLVHELKLMQAELDKRRGRL